MLKIILLSLFWITHTKVLASIEALELENTSHTAATEMRRDIKLMGIEIECPGIKIHPINHVDKVSFTIELANGTSWILEEDTADASFANTEYSGFNCNAELKTVGGYTVEEMIHSIPEMQKLLKYLFNYSNRFIELNSAELMHILLGLNIAPRRIYENNWIESFLIKSKYSKEVVDGPIRPQITYQMPLALIPMVFERLRVLKHDKVPCFLDALKGVIPSHITGEGIEKKSLELGFPLIM
jgi:hypothetical protein